MPFLVGFGIIIGGNVGLRLQLAWVRSRHGLGSTFYLEHFVKLRMPLRIWSSHSCKVKAMFVSFSSLWVYLTLQLSWVAADIWSIVCCHPR